MPNPDSTAVLRDYDQTLTRRRLGRGQRRVTLIRRGLSVAGDASRLQMFDAARKLAGPDPGGDTAFLGVFRDAADDLRRFKADAQVNNGPLAARLMVIPGLPDRDNKSVFHARVWRRVVRASPHLAEALEKDLRLIFATVTTGRKGEWTDRLVDVTRKRDRAFQSVKRHVAWRAAYFDVQSEDSGLNPHWHLLMLIDGPSVAKVFKTLTASVQGAGPAKKAVICCDTIDGTPGGKERTSAERRRNWVRTLLYCTKAFGPRPKMSGDPAWVRAVFQVFKSGRPLPVALTGRASRGWYDGLPYMAFKAHAAHSHHGVEAAFASCGLKIKPVVVPPARQSKLPKASKRLGGTPKSISRAALQHALKKGGTRGAAAAILGVSLPTLRNRCKSYGISPSARGRPRKP